jgi:dTDP-4-dehydrorhamnose reductase
MRMRLLITGASGMLGRYLVRVARQQGHMVTAWGSPRVAASSETIPIDLTNPAETAEAFWQAQPMAVIHGAAKSNLADCFQNPDEAIRVNVESTRQLVGLCVAGVSRLVYVSTDLVFDGRRGHYGEDDQPNPLSVYARTKASAEKAVLIHPGHLVVRLSWLVGSGLPEKPTFLEQQVKALRERKSVTLFEDEWRTPLCASAAAHALVELAAADCAGILHVGGPERLARYEMGLKLANLLGADLALVRKSKQAESSLAEPRPRDTSLDCGRWRELFPRSPWPSFDQALRQTLLGLA